MSFISKALLNKQTLKQIASRGLIVLIIVFGIGAIPWIGLNSISHKKTGEKIVALTFDDGPNDPYTSQILDILKAKNTAATFFLVGKNVEKEPEVTKKIVAYGNMVANHSYSHKLATMMGPTEDLVEDVNKGNNAIFAATGLKPRYYRPPYGYRTVWGDRVLSRNGYQIITWNDMTSDYRGMSPKDIIQRIVKKAKEGGIIVLHDGSETRHGVNRENSVLALPQIIDRLQAEGYKFVTIDKLIGQPAYF